MLTFSDLVQQVLCFFILLLSISKIDVVKVKAFERGWMAKTGAPNEVPVNNDMINALVNRRPDIGQDKGGVDIEGPVGEHLKVQRVHEGLRVVFEDTPMFAEGSSELDPAVFNKLNWLIQLAQDKRNYLDVRGFTAFPDTDSVEGDHMLLGFRRAQTVASAMIGNPQEPTIKPERIRISSRGYYDPIVPHDSTVPEERAKNRRVEVVISELLYDPDRPVEMGRAK